MKALRHCITILLMTLGLCGHALAQSTHVHFTDLARGALDNLILTQRGLGRELVDIERNVSSTGVTRFDAIFAPLPPGQVLALIDDTEANYNSFLNSIGSNGRLIDLEVDDAAGVWRFSALFWQSGETGIARDVRSRRSRAAFRALIEDQARSNYSLVDVEISAQNGNLFYSGVWQSHSGQARTVLYYDLAQQELAGILNQSEPHLTAGRVLDIERYHDPALAADRFAVLVALVEGAGERLSQGINLATFNNQHASTANAQTHLIDLESYYDGAGNQRYDALWGPGNAALVDVAPLRRDDVAVLRGATLDSLIGQIDSGAARLNNLGLFGLNLRTRQSVSWRADELFPLASVVKLAIHARLYRDAGLGLINPVTVQENFTTCSACTNPFQPHWVDMRSAPGMSCADRGLSYPLSRFAAGMMTVSDNAATGALLLREGGLARQSYSINDWMASLDGISQGWGPIISIAEQDRITYWRGQWSSGCVPPSALADSYLRAPLSAIEVHHRPSLTNSNVDACDGLPANRYLIAHFNPNPMPAVCFTDGERQFHDMGLNSATPRALGLLYEALATGQLVDNSQMSNLFAAMGGPDRLSVAPGFPGADEVYSKGGNEGSTSGSEPTAVVADSSLLRIGNDFFVLAIVGKHLSFSAGSLRTWSAATSNYPALGLAMLQRIAPDLRLAASAPVWQSPTTLAPGAAVQLQLRVRNEGGGSASPFRVSAHVSTNTTITATDPQIAFVDTTSLGINGERTLTLVGTLPANLTPGSYYVGWRLDPPLAAQPSTNPNGQVGEWDESSASNTGVLAGLQLIVTAALPQIFANGFE